MEDAARGFNKETAEVNRQTATKISKFQSRFLTNPRLLTKIQIYRVRFLISWTHTRVLLPEPKVTTAPCFQPLWNICNSKIRGQSCNFLFLKLKLAFVIQVFSQFNDAKIKHSGHKTCFSTVKCKSKSLITFIMQFINSSRATIYLITANHS